MAPAESKSVARVPAAAPEASPKIRIPTQRMVVQAEQWLANAWENFYAKGTVSRVVTETLPDVPFDGHGNGCYNAANTILQGSDPMSRRHSMRPLCTEPEPLFDID
jgi:hypothetical protein